MRLRRTAGKIMNSALRRLGYELCSIRKKPIAISMQAALSRWAGFGLDIRTVIDVGASNGSWSRIAQQSFPDAFFFLIEANEVHTLGLQKFKSQSLNVDYVLAAAGDSPGQIYFDATDPMGGQASHFQITPGHLMMPATTIDEQVGLRGLRPPFLLKLDTHGFEVPILQGAKDTLKKTNLIVMETYNFKLSAECLRFWEMCSYLEAFGFRPIDLVDPLHRPKDQAFWQMDLFFIPAINSVFQSDSYE